MCGVKSKLSFVFGEQEVMKKARTFWAVRPVLNHLICTEDVIVERHEQQLFLAGLKPVVCDEHNGSVLSAKTKHTVGMDTLASTTPEENRRDQAFYTNIDLSMLSWEQFSAHCASRSDSRKWVLMLSTRDPVISSTILNTRFTLSNCNTTMNSSEPLGHRTPGTWAETLNWRHVLVACSFWAEHESFLPHRPNCACFWTTTSCQESLSSHSS